MVALLNAGVTRTDIRPVVFDSIEDLLEDLGNTLAGLPIGGELHLAFVPQDQADDGGDDSTPWSVHGTIVHPPSVPLAVPAGLSLPGTQPKVPVVVGAVPERGGPDPVLREVADPVGG